ncbi:MAG: hypothetical protein MJ209_03210 [archaeon]|nr:hypothetical protein [archaeon]
MKFKNWKITLAICAIIAIIAIYGSYYLIFNDISHMVDGVWVHMGFIPIDILLVYLILDEIIGRKEKEAIQEKYDMIVSAFFMEIGNNLISKLANANVQLVNLKHFEAIKTWKIEDFDEELKKLKNSPPNFDVNLEGSERQAFLEDLKEFLHNNRAFLLNLIENPNLHEKEQFSALLMAISHLAEELEYRDDVSAIGENDFLHLVFDMNRVYESLVYEWVRYLRYNKKNYPYVMHMALRTNPFDKDASIFID